MLLQLDEHFTVPDELHIEHITHLPFKLLHPRLPLKNSLKYFVWFHLTRVNYFCRSTFGDTFSLLIQFCCQIISRKHQTVGHFLPAAVADFSYPQKCICVHRLPIKIAEPVYTVKPLLPYLGSLYATKSIWLMQTISKCQNNSICQSVGLPRETCRYFIP